MPNDTILVSKNNTEIMLTDSAVITRKKILIDKTVTIVLSPLMDKKTPTSKSFPPRLCM
ncbi:MAG: hypothetical protein AAGA27_05260 [Pseudomonadota bacterium]